MQKHFSNALSEAVSKHIDLSASRLETLEWLAFLIMRHGTICLWRLAAHVTCAATTTSVRRRFYRFFQYVKLDGAMAARVVAHLLNLAGKPWVLAMDRTNWDFGKTTINILMIPVIWNGMGVPLIWVLLLEIQMRLVRPAIKVAGAIPSFVVKAVMRRAAARTHRFF